MKRIRLYHPILLAGRTLAEVELRPPGRRVLASMAAVRVSTGFTDEQTIRFASRLSGLSTITVRKLSDEDIANLRQALDEHFAAEQRRQRARAAISAADEAALIAALEAGDIFDAAEGGAE